MRNVETCTDTQVFGDGQMQFVFGAVDDLFRLLQRHDVVAAGAVDLGDDVALDQQLARVDQLLARLRRYLLHEQLAAQYYPKIYKIKPMSLLYIYGHLCT